MYILLHSSITQRPRKFHAPANDHRADLSHINAMVNIRIVLLAAADAYKVL